MHVAEQGIELEKLMHVWLAIRNIKYINILKKVDFIIML